MTKAFKRSARFKRFPRGRSRISSRNYVSRARRIPSTIRETDAPTNDLIIRASVAVPYLDLAKDGFAVGLNYPVLYYSGNPV